MYVIKCSDSYLMGAVVNHTWQTATSADLAKRFEAKSDAEAFLAKYELAEVGKIVKLE